MSTAFHRCAHCGYVTDVSQLLPAFEENPHCTQCGLSASESDAKMQDELVALMSRNMHLSTMPVPTQDISTPSTPQVTPQVAPIMYITQHYHHSSHVASTQVQELQVSNILDEAGVTASALLPSQLHLFRNADPEQRQRLIELWRISPPTFGNQMPARYMSGWPQTSMEIEEVAARERWEQNQGQKNHQGVSHNHSAEPYMAQGYEHLPNINGMTAPSEYGSTIPKVTEYKQSIDPAYQSREWWNLNESERMEDQYGMIQQMQMQYHNYNGHGGMDHDME